MATLILGEEPCNIRKIANIMSKSASFSVLRQNWSSLAGNLGVPEVDIETWRHNLLLDKISLEDLMVQLVTNWKGRCGDEASMEVLCKALTDCNYKDIADKLDNEFAEIIKAQILASGEVIVQDHVIKISEIFATTSDLPPGSGEKLRKDNPNQILKNFQIPDRPRYYIQRTLSPRTRLDTAIFKSPSSDVFVLENVDWSTLDDTLFGSKVESSSRQTSRVTARFILLEDFRKDYERICQVVTPTSTPVHLVRFDSGSYYWVRSKGCLALIQQHVSGGKPHLNEEEFVNNYFSKFENAPVCIADTPGMGKSLLLASIAQRVKEVYPGRISLLMVLRELGQSSNAETAAINTTADHFWKQITTSDFAAEALKRLMESGRFQFEVFLDGFDEVLPNQIDYVNQLLLSLNKHKNTRIHVTTRPHMRNQLEDTLGQLGYNILPFTEDNQVYFLTRLWENCEEAKDEELDDSRLKSFGNQCLEKLKKCMNEQEQDIAGIPLQCALLAEVYDYDAVKYSMKQSKTQFELTCKVESIFDMYQQLIKKKMKRVEELGEGEKQELLVAHVREALELIFPDNDTCLLERGNGDLLTYLYAVGLMETSSNDAGPSPRFLHRTFAEFLIAEHLVKHLTCKDCSRLLVDVVLGELTRRDTVDEFVFEFFIDRTESAIEYDYRDLDFLHVKSFDFSQNVIAYFVNAHLDAVGNYFRTSSLKSIQNVDKVLSACCLNNYTSIFKGLSEVVLRGQVGSREWAWTDMALLAARYSEPNLMEQLVLLIQGVEGKKLCELEFPKERWSFQVTPLHMAVQRGSHIMTRYLVNELYTSLESLPYLLHACTCESSNDSEAIVQDKMEIIRLLIRMRKEVIHERIPRFNATPLLLPDVHVDMMCVLIEQGADVNTVDSKGDTMLHRLCKWSGSVTPADYTKVFNLLGTKKFNLWDKKGENNETPLYVAVRSIEVEYSVLKQYSQLNVDFNHVGEFPNEYYSVIFLAIKWDRTSSFIKKLEELGADVNYLTSEGQSALHIAAQHGNNDVARYLVTDGNLDVNHRDCKRQTPLHYAVLDGPSNRTAIQELLIDNGAELEDPEYKWRPTPLFHALSKSKGYVLSLDIVKKMADKGLGADHLALALEPLVKNKKIKAKGNGSEYSKLFCYFFEHGGRIQNPVKKLEQQKGKFLEAIDITEELLKQVKEAKRTDDMFLDGIHSATDLYERIVTGNIQLECVMLALLQCNQLDAFEAIRELLQYKNPRFENALPGVDEFIYAGNEMIVVAALDLELCAKRVLDTIDGVEEYQEGVQLLPGTIFLVKVQQHEPNLKEYLDGIAQLQHRFIVVCEALAAEVEHTYKVVQDHIGWDDLSSGYQDDLSKGGFLGFQLSQESKEEFFGILRDESLIELMRSGCLSTEDLGRISEQLVDQLDELQLEIVKGYGFKRLFPPNLAEIMKVDGYYDDDNALRVIHKMKWNGEEMMCAGYFAAARAVLNTTWNNQHQMQQILEYVFECEECQYTNSNEEDDKKTDEEEYMHTDEEDYMHTDEEEYMHTDEEEDMETHEQPDEKTDDDEEDKTMLLVEARLRFYRFKHDLFVYFIDWLLGMRSCHLPFDFQPDSPDKYTQACLLHKALNLVNRAFGVPNNRFCSFTGFLHMLVHQTVSLDVSHLQETVNFVLSFIRINPGSVNKLNQDMLSPLLVDKIHVELIDLLLYTGTNAFAVDQQGCTFVHYAASYLPSDQFQQLMRYLVDHKLTQLLNARDSEQRTPLFYLIQKSNPDPSTLKVLASAGVDFNATDKNDSTVLFYAVVYHTSVETLQALVRYGADWRKISHKNFNLLHHAAGYGNLEATKYFVQLELPVNSRDNENQTPLMYAVINTVKECNVEVVKFLLKQNADVSVTNIHGETVLSLAVAFNRSVTVLEALVEHGADSAWKNSHKNTLLQRATISGNLEAVKYFLRLQCSVNARDNDLDTPLISAVAEVDESIDNIEVVKFLLEHGADVNAANKEGHTALYYANKRNLSNICNLLTSNGATLLSLEV